MTTVHEPPAVTESTPATARFRRFRLIRGGKAGADHVVPEPPPRLVLLSPRAVRWLPSLTEALGPSYRVVTETFDTPAALVVDTRDDDLVHLVHEQRSATRVIVV